MSIRCMYRCATFPDKSGYLAHLDDVHGPGEHHCTQQTVSKNRCPFTSKRAEDVPYHGFIVHGPMLCGIDGCQQRAETTGALQPHRNRRHKRKLKPMTEDERVKVTEAGQAGFLRVVRNGQVG